MPMLIESGNDDFHTQESYIDHDKPVNDQHKPDVYYLAGASPVEKPILRMALERAGIKTIALKSEDAIHIQLSSS